MQTTQKYTNPLIPQILNKIQKIQSDLGRILIRLKTHFSAYPSKTKWMLLGTTHQIKTAERSLTLIFMNGEVLESISITRNLVLLIDHHLRFSDHISNQIRKAFYILRVLYGILEFLFEDIIKLFTDSLVFSLLDYCDVVYGPRLFQKSKKCIQRV